MMATGYFSKAVAWWACGLSLFYPRALKCIVGILVDQISIQWDEQQFIVRHYSVREDSWSRPQYINDDIEQHRLIDKIQQWQEARADIVLLLPDKFILKKTLSMPGAARSSLDEALGFELPRITPFDPTTAYFNYRIVKQDKTKLTVELLVTPKRVVEPVLKKLRMWNIKVNAISVVSDTAVPKTNLLPMKERYQYHRRGDRISLLLACCAFILVLAVLYLPLIQQQQQIDILQQQLRDTKETALQLKQFKDQQQKMVRQTSFFDPQHRSTFAGIELLNEITKILPDDTWLTRLVISDDQLQLQGESAKASLLVKTIESSPLFMKANFISPVTLNPATGKDKFYLSAKLSQRGEI